MGDFLTPLLGGFLIGLGSILAMLGSGKVPGISGIAARLLKSTCNDRSWRMLFLISMIAGAGAIHFFDVGWTAYSIPGGRPLFIYGIAGLLVGFGTRMGRGCTSGHGVCGMGAGAKDAMAYTMTFMATAIITVYLWSILFGKGVSG
ncbi:MAG: YeeE/YedE family protein [Akkermansiaceae bacterium]